MKNPLLEQAPAFLTDYSPLLLALYVGLFGGLFFLAAKIIRTKLGDFLRRWLAAVFYQFDRWFNTSLARRYTLKQYCRIRLGDETTKTLLVPSANLELKLDVDKSFVSLRLEHAAGERRFLDHASLLGIGQRIRVVGNPGSGKSSLVKRLLRDACALALRNPRQARLPVLLELRTLKLPPKADDRKRLGEWLFKAVRDQASKASAFNIGDCVDAYANGPGLLLLLDGLDEVASSDYPRMHQALLGLSQKLAAASAKNAIVLTMRTEFHKQVQKDFRDDFGHAVTVQPFSPSDIYLFLNRWPFDSATAQLQRNRIYKDLTDRASLREMCSNPLVLAMYVAQDQALASGAAPESRTAFYKQVADELLFKRRSKQTGPSRVARSVGEQRERILGKLALQHMLDPNEAANSLSWAHAIAVIKADLKVDDAKAEDYFYHDLATETGLIVEVQERESFRFIHLTFCEFFAALEACNEAQDGWLQLLQLHKAIQLDDSYSAKSRLTEVLPFACGLMLRGARAKALEQLAECADAGIVARAFLENKLYQHPLWASLVERWKKQLLATPEQEWNEEWLQNLHLFNVVTEDARQYKQALGGMIVAPEMDEFFKNLVARQRTSLEVLLHAYAKVDAAAVLRLAEMNHLDLANDFPEVVLKNCDQGPFFALLLEHALQDQECAYAWACLFAEAGWRSQAVADALAAMPEQDNWRGLAQAVPRQFSWLDTKLISNSFYTQCLTIANGPNQTSQLNLPVLHAVRQVSAPAAYSIFFNSAWLPLFCCAVFLFELLGFIVTSNNFSMDLTQGIFFCSWAMLIISINWKVRFGLAALMFQRHICGLGDGAWINVIKMPKFVYGNVLGFDDCLKSERIWISYLSRHVLGIILTVIFIIVTPFVIWIKMEDHLLATLAQILMFVLFPIVCLIVSFSLVYLSDRKYFLVSGICVVMLLFVNEMHLEMRVLAYIYVGIFQSFILAQIFLFTFILAPRIYWGAKLSQSIFIIQELRSNMGGR